MRASVAVVRSSTWWALLGYTVVASGLPLPFGSLPADRGAVRVDPAASWRLAGKDRSRPFPCIDKTCGCATAEQCFTSCCCHSPAERLAWARARGCEAAVLAALTRAAPPRPAPAASCCAAAGACSAAKPSPSSSAGSRDRTVSLRAMLACDGIIDAWLAASIALPPPRVEMPLPLPCPERVVGGDARGAALRAAPDLPPPRAA